MAKKKKRTYEVRFRDLNGNIKSFLFTGSSPKDAQRRLKTPGRVINVRKAFI